MRIGGGIDGREWNTPEEWLAIVKELNYDAVYCPIDSSASENLRRDFKKLIKDNDLVLGEVGAWANPLDIEEEKRKKNLAFCKAQLSLADEMEAACCVNIAGCRGEKWDGAYPDNYDPYTYELIVDTVREIIDAVKPSHTYYTLEPMPWMLPDSPESYLELIRDIDRETFAVHLDYANMISSPKMYLHNGEFIRHCFRLLGPYIKSIHAKDLVLAEDLPCVLHEAPPGRGKLDLKLVMQLAGKLGTDMTVYAEHLKDVREYEEAVRYLRSLAKAD